MTGQPRLWMRSEHRPTERRAPIAPADARRLVENGIPVTVEESGHRVFATSEYADAGCRIAEAGTWVRTPHDTYIVGLKEPSDDSGQLRHRHIFFGHAYQGQDGAQRLLRRFAAGGGVLLDLEYLTDDAGRRAAAFGYWAGFIGAALAVLHHRGGLDSPLHAMARDDWRRALRRQAQAPVSALVIGARGRSGGGVLATLSQARVATTAWDVEETRDLDRAALLDHDIMVNCVQTTEPGEAFLTVADLAAARRLSVLSDVTCDITSACNRLPVYNASTDWSHPVRRLHPAPNSLDLIAIDNLPSLVPRESSAAFSADLTPYLRSLGDRSAAWDRCLREFRTACAATDIEERVSA